MKKRLFMTIPALVLVFGLVVVGCDELLDKLTQYTVSFDSNGGSAVAPMTGIAENAVIISLPTPTKASNTFGGWFIDNTTFENEFTTTTPVTANITVFAYWTATHTVSFDSNGGSAVASVTGIAEGATVPSLPTPTKIDYDFGGWFIDNTTFENEFTTATPVTDDITVFAYWTESTVTQYTVTFDPMEGSVTPTSTAVAPGETVASLPTPTKANSIFQGWFTDNGSFLNVFDSTKPVTANITVYAKWKTWLTAMLLPTVATTTPNTTLYNATLPLTTNVQYGDYFDNKVDPIIEHYPVSGMMIDNTSEHGRTELMWIGRAGGYSSMSIKEEEYLKSVTQNKTLYEYTDWHNADHTLSVTISDINGTSVTNSITEVVSLALGNEKIGYLTASITKETTSTVAKVKALTTQSTWDLRDFDPAYQYKVIVIAQVDIHDFYWESVPLSEGWRTGPFSTVNIQPETVQMVLVSRLKP
jgi:uncharacterized repeat protein (TIGR02543 family)